MLEYISKALATWLVGFAPQLEVYLAVPAGVAMGLDYVSAVVWSVLGNFTAVPTTIIFFDQIRRFAPLRRLIDRRYSEKNQQRLNRYGPWFVLAATPLVGIWVVAVMARVANMNPRTLLISSFLSVSLYATVVAVLLYFGIELFS